MVYDPEKYELEYIFGDKVPTPTVTADGGLTSGWGGGFTVGCIAHPNIRYRDQMIEGDLYRAADGSLSLHIICPKCFHGLKIDSKNKQIDWDYPYISVEPFECSWELDPSIPVGVLTITNLCKWRVGISRGIAKDAK